MRRRRRGLWVSSFRQRSARPRFLAVMRAPPTKRALLVLSSCRRTCAAADSPFAFLPSLPFSPRGAGSHTDELPISSFPSPSCRRQPSSMRPGLLLRAGPFLSYSYCVPFLVLAFNSVFPLSSTRFFLFSLSFLLLPRSFLSVEFLRSPSGNLLAPPFYHLDAIYTTPFIRTTPRGSRMPRWRSWKWGEAGPVHTAAQKKQLTTIPVREGGLGRHVNFPRRCPRRPPLCWRGFGGKLPYLCLREPWPRSAPACSAGP